MLRSTIKDNDTSPWCWFVDLSFITAGLGSGRKRQKRRRECSFDASTHDNPVEPEPHFIISKFEYDYREVKLIFKVSATCISRATMKHLFIILLVRSCDYGTVL